MNVTQRVACCEMCALYEDGYCRLYDEFTKPSNLCSKYAAYGSEYLIEGDLQEVMSCPDCGYFLEGTFSGQCQLHDYPVDYGEICENFVYDEDMYCD